MSVCLSPSLTDFAFSLSLYTCKCFSGLCPKLIHPSFISPFHKHRIPALGQVLGWVLAINFPLPTPHSRTSMIPAAITTTSVFPVQAFPEDQPCVLNSSWTPDHRRRSSDTTKGPEHHLPKPALSSSCLSDFYYLFQHFLGHWS